MGVETGRKAIFQTVIGLILREYKGTNAQLQINHFYIILYFFVNTTGPLSPSRTASVIDILNTDQSIQITRKLDNHF